MDWIAYYQEIRKFAREKRVEYNLTTRDIGLSQIRDIYRSEGIEICPNRRRLRNLKAAYFNDRDGCCVLLNMNLPTAPRLFAMVHELKHHYKDRDKYGWVCVEVADNSPRREIAAEIFAGEFIFPEEEFRQYIRVCGITRPVSPQSICYIMHHSPAIISYQFILKRLAWMGLIDKGKFQKFHFANLHAEIYGSPHYRRRGSLVEEDYEVEGLTAE